MPGFFVSNTVLDMDLADRYPERCKKEDIFFDQITAKRNTLNKFLGDKAFDYDGNYLIILEGYLLNKVELFQIYQTDKVASLIREMYKRNGETFFNTFRGSFAGVLYDKALDKWLIFTNHTGENPVFYALFGSEFYAGSQVTYLLDAMHKTKYSLHFDEDGAYQILTFGFMERDNTFAQEIRRLRGGTYLCVEHGHAYVKEYHMFHKHPERFNGISEREIISRLDEAFRKAVELEYRKDEEYGLQHLADMSGGFDSRMSAWVAHDLKTRHIQLLTYCRANYLDEIIAKQIAQYWKDEIIVKPLEDLSFVFDIDEIVAYNGGLSIYTGITGGKRLLDSLNVERFGLEHTGMIGDVVIGSYCKQLSDLDNQRPTGRYSEKLKRRLVSSEEYKKTFDDHELYVLYTRGFQGMAGTYLIRKNYTEAVSAFMDVDFFQLCMDIPLEMRMNHKLYKKWLLSTYPEAAKFKWEKINGKIGEPQIISNIRHILHRGPNKVFQLLGKSGAIAAGMNPMDYWMDRDEHARQFWNDYYNAHYPKLITIASEQFCEDVKLLFNIGNANEKAMVLTMLSAIECYFTV